MIEVVKNGSIYEVSVPPVSYEKDIRNLVAHFAVPRIVQNTSREHVVEVPDTAKINTLLSAGLTGNEVSQQLGLTLGAEIAAAISSSSAFIKRIPYAVPFTGQSLCVGCERKEENNQSFGWKYYKTPSGVTQFGGIAQSFKTIPLNSAVVVSMPEWMSKPRAEYEISEDAGRTWKPVGGENIVLSGAALRGILAETGAMPFDTWVKYNIYREVDDAVGLPRLKNCYGAGENIIYGNSGHCDMRRKYSWRKRSACGWKIY